MYCDNIGIKSDISFVQQENSIYYKKVIAITLLIVGLLMAGICSGFGVSSLIVNARSVSSIVLTGSAILGFALAAIGIYKMKKEIKGNSGLQAQGHSATGMSKPHEKSQRTDEAINGTLAEKRNQDYARRLCEDPYGVLNDEQFKKDYPSLDICRCPKVTSEQRIWLESHSMELLKKIHFSSASHDVFQVVSVGPGSCFQELVYLAKLKESNIKKIRLILIDTDLEVAFRRLSLLDFSGKYFSDCEISIVFYESLDRYLKNEKSATHHLDLLLLIDLTKKMRFEKTDAENLRDYAYRFFRKNNLLDQGSVISYTTSTALDYEGFINLPHKIEYYNDGFFIKRETGVCCQKYNGEIRLGRKDENCKEVYHFKDGTVVDYILD